jgi:hypothetical protein
MSDDGLNGLLGLRKDGEIAELLGIQVMSDG